MAEAIDKLKKEATKLGIPFDSEKVTEDELADLIKEKKEAQAEEDRIKKENAEKAEKAKKSKIILKNVFGEDMDEKDYFWPGEKKDATGNVERYWAPFYFNKVCGFPVDREDMLEIFNKIFNPDDNFLFYKVRDKEMYIVIVPLKFSSVVGKEHESVGGDFQKHAISFIGEGSVNMDTLKAKLKAISGFVKKANE